MRGSIAQLRVDATIDAIFLTLKELRRFDYSGVAVALDGLEVSPVVSDDLCLPSPRADRD